MRILIDADGCPVTDKTVKVARKYNMECLILCDTSHIIEKEGATTFTFPKGADSVDFELVNMVKPSDIVVTQDYGLAAMCLARNAIPINQNGMIYTNENIDGLLFSRYANMKVKRAGGRLKGPAKRKKEQDKAFEDKLKQIILKNI